MKLLNFTLVPKDQLKKLYENLNHQNLQIKNAAEFIKEIESGNLDATFKIDSKEAETENLLVTSLESMRNKMKKISMDEEERNWVREGLARFVEILRAKSSDTNELADSIISNLVKYMNANQGALYIVNDETADVFIERAACYAYNRKKHLNQKIALGEGLVGQVVLEKQTMYMTNIPNDFLKITSGLGEALPGNLLIVPLKLEENVLGVVEVASFAQILPYQIKFIERLGESIASSLSAVKTTQRTNTLLKESQFHAEQLRSQEEEMRQNMEELAATQEEMQRILREVEGKEAYVKHLLDVSSDSIYTVDKEYKLVSWNKTFARSLEQFGMRLEKGSSTLDWYKGDERIKQLELYERALKGEMVEFTAESEINGSKYYFHSIYASLTDQHNEIYEIAVFSRNVTEAVEARQKTEKLLNESQQRAEELKAQEEELRQNMEELSATQDEMQRILTEVQNRETFMTDLMNATNDSIITIDRDYKIISCNKTTYDTYAKFGMEVGKGFNIFDLFTEEQRPIYKAYYDRALNGETFEATERYSFKDKEQHFAVTYSPLRDQSGAIIAAAVFGKDISEIVSARTKSEKLLNESQQQSEELKAQEEELRQNMEELSATQEEMQRILDGVQKNERYIKSLLDESTDSILTLDKNYTLIHFNKTFAASFESKGISVDKGFDILNIFPEELRDEKRKLYKRIFNGETVEIVDQLTTSGFNNTYAVRHAPLRDAEGNVEAIAIIARDTTTETNCQQKVKELSVCQDFMQEVLNGCKVAIHVVDEEFRLLDFNQAFQQRIKTNTGVDLVKGMILTDIIENEKERAQMFKHLKRVFKGESFEQLLQFTRGETIIYHNERYTPIRNTSGKIVAAGVYAEDVTELISVKKLNEKLQAEKN